MNLMDLFLKNMESKGTSHFFTGDTWTDEEKEQLNQKMAEWCHVVPGFNTWELFKDSLGRYRAKRFTWDNFYYSSRDFDVFIDRLTDYHKGKELTQPPHDNTRR